MVLKYQMNELVSVSLHLLKYTANCIEMPEVLIFQTNPNRFLFSILIYFTFIFIVYTRLDLSVFYRADIINTFDMEPD